MKIRHLSGAGLLTVALLGAAPAFATPTAPPEASNQHPTPAQNPYASTDVAQAAVDAAFAKAKTSGKNVLIDFGGNWCPDCRLLAGVFKEENVGTWLDQNFETVSVNVGHFDANMDIAAKYGVKIKAVPTVLIITPQGKLLNADGTLALGNARTMSAQAVLTLLDTWNRRT